MMGRHHLRWLLRLAECWLDGCYYVTDCAGDRYRERDRRICCILVQRVALK